MEMISLRVPCRGQNSVSGWGSEGVDVVLSNSLLHGGMNFSELGNIAAFEIVSFTKVI